MCWKKACISESCNTESQCPIEMTCHEEICIEREKCVNGSCGTDTSTGLSQVCIDKEYCRPNFCTLHSDCPNDMACVYGRCQHSQNKPCQHDKQCGRHEYCELFLQKCCPKICYNDGHCNKNSGRNDYVCDHGMCIPSGKTDCERMEHCGKYENCRNGKCTDFCLVHQDCQHSSLVCSEDQRCIKEPQCNEDNEGQPCPTKGMKGLICLNNKCQLKPTKDCWDDRQCKKGFCRNRICVNLCRYNYDCQRNEVCTNNGCVRNRCTEGSTEDVCKQTNMICVKDECKRRCNNNFECQLSEYCNKGFCTRSECQDNSDCKILSLNAKCNKKENICILCQKRPCKWCRSFKDCSFKNSEDCVHGVCQKCKNGQCKKCDETESDCPSGYQCIRKRCLLKQCGASIHDCPKNTKCSQGICAGTSNHCKGKEDCNNPTQDCVFEQCVDICNRYGTCGCKESECRHQQCTTNRNCSRNQHCDLRGTQECIERCKLDNDCKGGEECSFGICKIPECKGARDCSAKLHCQVGQCVPSQNCSQNLDSCPMNDTVKYYCNIDDKCVAGQPCNRYDSQCPTSFECDVDHGICLPRRYVMVLIIHY